MNDKPNFILKEDVDRALASMVNRVAWAISASFHEEGYIEGQSDPNLFAEFEKAARRAIEAMREPTKAMIEAGWAWAHEENAAETWREMIDEALK